MWQNVISFDNRWLEKLGVYNSKTGYIDESKLQNITRLSTKEMLDKKGMISSSIWSASIHYNTDNIHIYIAIIEPNPVTKRGMIKQKDMEKMKSKVVNNLLDISKSHEKINQLIREDIIKKRSSNLFIKDIELNKIFKNYFENAEISSIPIEEKTYFGGYIRDTYYNNFKDFLEDYNLDKIYKNKISFVRFADVII
ncbi:MAG: hypothetical protein KFW09_05670, partial [Oscillospiraceae bacterium]|nr:hypothetical protein [Oscillospiraceae bacterium]